MKKPQYKLTEPVLVVELGTGDILAVGETPGPLWLRLVVLTKPGERRCYKAEVVSTRTTWMKNLTRNPSLSSSSVPRYV